MSDLRKIIIDDHEVEVDPKLTLIQACEQAGIEVPRFCYHERLSIAGNCRMCLVEVVGGPPKPGLHAGHQIIVFRKPCGHQFQVVRAPMAGTIQISDQITARCIRSRVVCCRHTRP